MNAPAIVGGPWFHGLFALSTQCKLICIHEYAESHIRVIATESHAHCLYTNETSSIVQTWISRQNTVETEYVHLFYSGLWITPIHWKNSWIFFQKHWNIFEILTKYEMKPKLWRDGTERDFFQVQSYFVSVVCFTGYTDFPKP